MAEQGASSFGVERLALVVHHLVVLEHLLALVVEEALHLVLGAFQGAGEQAGFDRLVVVHMQAIEHRGQLLARKDAHQLVVEGEEEAGAARIALAASTAAQLVVDSAGVVAFRADHMQSAGFAYAFPFWFEDGGVVGLHLVHGLP